MEKKPARAIALLPIGVFLVLYLGLGIVFEYVLKIKMGFYNIPIVVAFLAAILVACLQNRALSFDEKLEVMAKGVGDKNIMTMILIFLAAGVFVGVVGRSSAESVAYFMLAHIPARFAVAVLFVVSCFVSTAMGTSCGTITLIVPIAVAVARTSGFSLPLCIGSVMGGAMFGDNLSFISDTTIAACNTQGCEMKDKFRTNFRIALPAALVTLALILVFSLRSEIGAVEIPEYHLLQTLPYLLVLIGGVAGINVFVVLLTGIFSGAVIMLATGATHPTELLGNMGSGASGMFETIMVTILVSAMCGLIREYGGFEALLGFIKRIFHGQRGGQLGIGLLVGAMDIATANNTVAIVMAGPIAKQMSEEYGISSKKSASLLDTFSCIFQGIIPYGAQMLLAISACAELGETLTAFEIIPCLFYPTSCSSAPWCSSSSSRRKITPVRPSGAGTVVFISKSGDATHRRFWRGRRDLNYGSSFYRLKLCEIPYENQCVLFIAYNGVQSNAKPLGEKIGENSGGKIQGAQWSASPALLLYSPRRRARSERMPATYPLVQIEPSSRMIPV
ncbi:MAG: Na+/H+ antiporter NhaC family protein [Oscillospiraceae bacterium]